ncbi:MAG: tetratricopeptide repeat protein [Methanobacteriaceae archaeon]
MIDILLEPIPINVPVDSTLILLAIFFVIALVIGIILWNTILPKLFDDYEKDIMDNKEDSIYKNVHIDSIYRNLVKWSVIITYITVILFCIIGTSEYNMIEILFVLFSSTIVFTLQLYFKEIQKVGKTYREHVKGHKYIQHAINLNLKQCERYIEHLILSKHEDVEFNHEIWDKVYDFILKLDIDPGLIGELLKIQDQCKILNMMEKEFKNEENNTAQKEKIVKRIYSFMEKLDKLMEKYYENSKILAETYFNRGNFYFSMKEYKDAIKFLDKSLKIGFESESEHRNGNIYTKKGTTFDRCGKYEYAIRCFDKALDIDRDNNYPHINKGSALNKLKKFPEAIKCCEKVLKNDSKNRYALNTKGYALYGCKKYDDAINLHDKVLENNNNDVSALFGKGDCLFKCKKYDDAIDCYKKILEIEPENKYAKIRFEKYKKS